MHDLPRLGIDGRILDPRLEVGERIERADGDLGPEEERLERRDRGVTPEHGHEPGHAGGEERSPVLPRPHAEGSEVGN